jgi:hypothetical protein
MRVKSIAFGLPTCSRGCQKRVRHASGKERKGAGWRLQPPHNPSTTRSLHAHCSLIVTQPFGPYSSGMGEALTQIFGRKRCRSAAASHTGSESYRGGRPAAGACQQVSFDNFSFARLRVLACACAWMRVSAWGLEACSCLASKSLRTVCYTCADENETKYFEGGTVFVLPSQVNWSQL